MDVTRGGFQIAFHTERPIDASAVRLLYALNGWWPQRQEHAIARVLESDLALAVWNDDRLIGFARAVSDGQFRAYLEDVVVHPHYQRRGLAVALLTRLVNALSYIETLSLFCRPELVGLYEKVGFRAYRSQIVMHRANDTR